MRTKYNKRRFRTLIMIIVLLLCMSIGYSYLLTTLNIEGTSNIKSNTWDVHWENVSVKSGSVTGDQVPIAAHILTDTTQVEYSVILKNPGEYYEFTVDAKNAGSLDAMVSIADTKFYESNGVTQISLPDYLEYSFTYDDDLPVLQNQILKANTLEKLKVKLKFKDNLEESQLPTTDKTIIVRHNIVYVQSDENSTPVREYEYEGLNKATFQTPEAAMNASGYPFFIRNHIIDNEISSSDVGFKYNGNIYYLKAGVNELNSPTHPVYDENRAVLLEALGNSHCSPSVVIDSTHIVTDCQYDDGDYNQFSVHTTGTVMAFNDYYICEISSDMTSCVIPHTG